MATKSLRVLPVLAGVLLPAAALADDAPPLSELRTLGPGARARWPALADLVDQAEALGASERTGAKAIRRERYGGTLGASADEARRDRRALREALEALRVLERAAPERERPAVIYRGVQRQLLGLLARSFRAHAADDDPPAAVPRIDPAALDSGRSYGELFAELPRTRVTLYGVVPPTILLVHELAKDAQRRGPVEAGPLGAEAFARTLVQARVGQRYGIAGTRRGGRDYEGEAILERERGRMVLTRRVEGRAVRGTLERTDAAGEPATWRLRAPVRRTSGLAEALAGAEDPADLRFEARYRVASPEGPGVLRGRWRLLERGDDRDRVVAQGRETLRRTSAPLGLERLLALSDLMAAIVDAAAPVASEGTVPADLLLSGGNAPSREALITGPEIFSAHARLIEEAEREVLLQTFTWEVDSEASREVLGALERLERRLAGSGEPRDAPVRVRIVVNGAPFSDDPTVGLDRALERLDLDPRRLDVETAKHGHSLVGALHTKALVVDGRAGIVGGANVEAIHDAGAPWYDSAYRIEGPAARALRADFLDAWHKVTGAWLPPLEGPPVEGRAGGSPVLVATRRADGNPLSNGTDDPQGRVYAAAIGHARERVRILSPNLNDDMIKDALLDAVERGVRVELLLSRGFNEDAENLPGQGGDNGKNVAELLQRARERGGAQALARLDVRWYCHEPGVAVDGNGPHASHAKYASFDGRVAVVGSANMDTQTLNHSREVNLVVDDPRVVASWDGQVFEPAFGRSIPAGVPPPGRLGDARFAR